MCYKRLQSLIQNLFFNCSLSFLCLARRRQNDHPVSNEFSFHITYYISTRNIVWNNQIENDVWPLLFTQTGAPEKKFMQHSERYDCLVSVMKEISTECISTIQSEFPLQNANIAPTPTSILQIQYKVDLNNAIQICTLQMDYGPWKCL